MGISAVVVFGLSIGALHVLLPARYASTHPLSQPEYRAHNSPSVLVLGTLSLLAAGTAWPGFELVWATEHYVELYCGALLLSIIFTGDPFDEESIR